MRKRLPAFPIITISGMTTLDFVSNAPELFNVICLQRSLRPAELVRAVDAATAPRPPGAAEMRAAGTAASRPWHAGSFGGREQACLSWTLRNAKRPGEPGR